MAAAEMGEHRKRGSVCRGLHATVVGGSIGGLAAAIALKRAGANVNVFERKNVMEDEGAGVILRSFGVEALARLGVRVSAPLLWVWRYGSIQSGRGMIRAEVKLPLTAYSYAKLRQELSAAAAGVECRAGVRVTGFRVKGDHLRIKINHDAEIDTDFIVIAEGLDSATRMSMFPEMSIDDTGVVLFRGFISEEDAGESFSPEVLSRFSRSYTSLFPSLPGGGWWQGHLQPEDARSAGRMFQWSCYTPANEEDRKILLTENDGIARRWNTRPGRMTETSRRWLRARLESLFGPHIARLAAGQSTRVFRVVKFAVPSMVSGRVCLVGDAAHVTPPWTMAGASLALADGVALADRLRDARDLDEGLSVWNAERLSAARSMLAAGDRLQQVMIDRPPDLAAVTREELNAWIEGVLPPEPHQHARIVEDEEQESIFDE